MRMASVMIALWELRTIALMGSIRPLNFLERWER